MQVLVGPLRRCETVEHSRIEAVSDLDRDGTAGRSGATVVAKVWTGDLGQTPWKGGHLMLRTRWG